METVYVALGSNLGDRDKILSGARAAIASLPGTSIIAESEIEETDPIGPLPQGRYLNQMIAVSTVLRPRALLAELQRIEESAGRLRGERWGARTLDLDIVMLKHGSYSDEALTIPHPELPNRDFWQRELAQLRGVAHA